MTRLLLIGMIAVLELASLPLASAQSPTPAFDQRLSIQAALQAATTRDPQQFLLAAKQQLDAVPTTTLNGDTRKKLAQLREDFERLVSNYEGQQAPNPANGVTAVKASEDVVVDWKLNFDQVERDLASILGIGPLVGGSATPSVAGTGVVQTTGATSTSAVGLTGVAVEDIGVKNLDPAVRSQLEDVRESVELFYDATVSPRRP
jgi:hypothetical protein